MDKELLLAIVSEQYFNIIENKKTDGVSLKEKNKAWEGVAEAFNSSTTNEIRTWQQLKNAYNNIKRQLKKQNADEQVEIYKTGGGTPHTSKLDPSQVRLYSLLKPQIEPKQNPFDSSADYFGDNVCDFDITAPIVLEEIEPITKPANGATGSEAAMEPPSTKNSTAYVDGSPCTSARSVSKSDMPPKKKRKLNDIHDCVENFTKQKPCKLNAVEKNK